MLLKKKSIWKQLKCYSKKKKKVPFIKLFCYLHWIERNLKILRNLYLSSKNIYGSLFYSIMTGSFNFKSVKLQVLPIKNAIAGHCIIYLYKCQLPSWWFLTKLNKKWHLHIYIKKKSVYCLLDSLICIYDYKKQLYINKIWDAQEFLVQPTSPQKGQIIKFYFIPS